MVSSYRQHLRNLFSRFHVEIGACIFPYVPLRHIYIGLAGGFAEFLARRLSAATRSIGKTV